ncbi:CvpA family protein [Bacteroides mediterraneensis]|uniref:CvpA family protein n=1 Tax=Bacteroides mediterraneensis TaxID=1841856 RepID=UPI0026EB3520|nr:CvpA family protein [Bacteroides mediterraneensis]
METLDWIIVAVLAMGAVSGFMKGLLKQLASMVGLVAGLLVARALFASLGEQLAVKVGTSVTVGQILAFLLIGLVVPLVLSVVASTLTKIVDRVSLGFVNRWLGAGLGALKYALLVSVVIHFIDFADSKDNLIHSTTKGSSLLYYPVKDLSGFFYPMVENLKEKFIETDNNQI